jgi:hypothetical protein
LSVPSRKIDPRDLKGLIEELRKYAPFYIPEWDPNNEADVGVTLAKIFAGMMSYVVDRENKIPTKNYIEFLNRLGTKLIPAYPATANIVFLISDRAKNDVAVEAGTKLLAASNDKHKELTFETQENFQVTRAKLVEIYSVVMNEKSDALYSHINDYSNGKSFGLFMGKSLQNHVLYLGDLELFNIKKNSKIILDFFCNDPDLLIAILEKAVWKYNWQVNPDNELETNARYLYAKILDSDESLKKCSITLSFAKSGDSLTFSQNLYLPGDTAAISDWRTPTDSKLVTVTSSADPNGISILLEPVTTGYQTTYFLLTSTEGSSSDFASPKLQVKEGDQLTAYYGDEFCTSWVANTKSKTAIEITELQKIESRWIQCSLSPIDFVAFGKKIESLEVFDIRSSISPDASDEYLYRGDMLFHGDVQLDDTQSPILPFEDQLYEKELFYISSEDVFSRRGSKVTISFSSTYDQRLLFEDKDADNELDLSWEYWNGRNWSHIINLEHKYGESTSGNIEQSISFICPSDFAQTSVNGNENYWIRARIVSVSGSIQVPTIINYWLSLQIALAPSRVQHCMTLNNHEFLDNINKSDNSMISHHPFYSVKDKTEGHPAIFMGMDEKIRGGPISLYCSLKESELLESDTRFFSLRFFYFSETGEWKKLDTIDNTMSLSNSGYIKFLFPHDFGRLSILGRSLYWIKGIDEEGKFASSADKIWLDAIIPTSGSAAIPIDFQGVPQFNGLFLNATSALNITSIDEEVIGSSTGEKDQTFVFSQKPVISIKEDEKLKNKVWVNENKFITEEEREQLRKKGEIQEKVDEQGRIIETWVLWHEVNDIYFSEAYSREYELDGSTGEALFGTAFSRVPPTGSENIRSSYHTGGGIIGNVDTAEINSMKNSLPLIDGVTNVEPATSGMDTETTERALKRGSRVIKHRGQPVTFEDFEWIVREGFPGVAKVKCFPTSWLKGEFKPGHIIIVVIPWSNEQKPLAPFELRKNIEHHLEERASNVVVSAKHLKVLKPIYLRISVQAEIYVLDMHLARTVEMAGKSKLVEFLHPISGGPKNSGWEFGEMVCLSDIMSILEKIPEVDHIENISIKLQVEVEEEGRRGPENKIILQDLLLLDCSKMSLLNSDGTSSTISIPPYFMIYSGEHNITVRLQSDREKKEGS